MEPAAPTMLNNSDYKFIAEWISEPRLLNEQEQLQLKSLIEHYPFLVPARMMHAADKYVQDGFSKDVLHEGRLFMGNWLLFYNVVVEAGQVPARPTEAEPVAEVAPETPAEAAPEKITAESADAKKVVAPQPVVEVKPVPTVVPEPVTVAAPPVAEETLPPATEEITAKAKTETAGKTATPIAPTQHKRPDPRIMSAIPEEDALDPLIQPIFADNYFQHQGIAVSEEIPDDLDALNESVHEKSLLVMMKFEEWLMFLKKKSEAKAVEERDRAMLRSIWQREKLAAAVGEEDDNIPEAVFEMAINSIDRQEILVSESLAEIHLQQGHFDKAVEIYRKLSLQNPEKNDYFAAKINSINNEPTL